MVVTMGMGVHSILCMISKISDTFYVLLAIAVIVSGIALPALLVGGMIQEATDKPYVHSIEQISDNHFAVSGEIVDGRHDDLVDLYSDVDEDGELEDVGGARVYDDKVTVMENHRLEKGDVVEVRSAGVEDHRVVVE
jgi:hypothetical protein